MKPEANSFNVRYLCVCGQIIDWSSSGKMNPKCYTCGLELRLFEEKELGYSRKSISSYPTLKTHMIEEHGEKEGTKLYEECFEDE